MNWEIEIFFLKLWYLFIDNNLQGLANLQDDPWRQVVWDASRSVEMSRKSAHSANSSTFFWNRLSNKTLIRPWCYIFTTAVQRKKPLLYFITGILANRWISRYSSREGTLNRCLYWRPRCRTQAASKTVRMKFSNSNYLPDVYQRFLLGDLF